MSKYNQKQPSERNEFYNMPSIECRSSAYRITKRNIDDELDMAEVKAICDKYNINIARIDQTFGGDDITLLFYVKVEEFGDADRDKCYEEDKKKNPNAFKPYWDMKAKYTNRILELHKCINELDQNTNLFFDYGWAGNVGMFGSHDVSRQSYSGGDYLYTWKGINNHWDSMIHNTSRVLSKKGGYYLIDSKRFKINPNQIYNEFTIESACELAKSLFPKEHIELVEGKTQADGDRPCYTAIVIGEGYNQVGHLTFGKDINGIVTMGVHRPLAGSYQSRITRDNIEKELKETIECML